jgi:hypothetical protein
MSFNVVPTNNAFKANFAENVLETSISSGSYTPTITSLNEEATDIEVRNSSWVWVRLGDFVHIDGNLSLTLPDTGLEFTLFISPPDTYPIVEPSSITPPSGSLVATGGNGSEVASAIPIVVSGGWVSNIPGALNSNTFQVVMGSNINMNGQDLTRINFHIVYKVVA